MAVAWHHVAVKCLALVLVLAACVAPPTWQVHKTPAGVVYEYAEDTASFAPDDPGGYLVRAKDDSPAGRRALRAILGGADDVVDGGFVVRLSAAALFQVALAPEVASIAPLVAAARRGPLGEGATTVTIDLFDGVRPEERAAVAAWLTAHGAQLAQTGGTIVGTMPAAIARAAARLGPVRWVAAKVGDDADGTVGPR